MFAIEVKPSNSSSRNTSSSNRRTLTWEMLTQMNKYVFKTPALLWAHNWLRCLSVAATTAILEN
jgi:hypothetical protein